MPRDSDRHIEQTRRRAGLELVQGASAAPASEPAADLLRQSVAGVGGAGVWQHLLALQRIADDNGGDRASPGPDTTRAWTTRSRPSEPRASE